MNDKTYRISNIYGNKKIEILLKTVLQKVEIIARTKQKRRTAKLACEH